MPPAKPIPFPDDFGTADEYVDSLLRFSASSTLFQTLCGGVHILDFFTSEPSLYHKVIPEEWRSWLLAREPMDLLDFLMRDELEQPREDEPPESLTAYVKVIRKHSLRRDLPPGQKETKLARHVAVGMIPKKVHEVSRFSDLVSQIAEYSGEQITHFVDFGSGQNYLGRALASPPYNKHVVAVESKELNVKGAKRMDIFAGVGEREKVMRNKKAYRQIRDSVTPVESTKDNARRAVNRVKPPVIAGVDFRPMKDLDTVYTHTEGKGYMQYVEATLHNGDLSSVVGQIEKIEGDTKLSSSRIANSDSADREALDSMSSPEKIRIMAVSIHSCGNLSHHAIRSLVLNTTVQAIAIVGCCYNLLSSRLGPPTLKHPHLRRNLQAINAPEGSKQLSDGDPHGFPMSERLATYGEEGFRLNITARMMAVQAPQNWAAKESDSFFTRHFYRALLQKLFLDYGVVSKIADSDSPDSTEPVSIGSLRKGCYGSFTTYVRGALEKLKQDPEKNLPLDDKMGGITDEELELYWLQHKEWKKELSAIWSLMAFSAGVVESLIVVDRWLFLKEQKHLVRDCWVQPVFEYQQSPRNLVVVGLKR
ncbi:Uncharacterized protein BP5553_05700 [Venustampulla echinocandica]|uniref:Methyltransferase domain-containing protein n=1 Tax=Venustampulla echinocandica TaxID=2656787 RepID=A0A370TLE3_9HELO|nr:Uncharacterized protein BP5553_05700 [Venustampulla echinocandica]RDL36348.1 Uncharacterized protein BP5553_05700 [Venustampulla echinocandica]